jgi:hypothetical protein
MAITVLNPPFPQNRRLPTERGIQETNAMEGWEMPVEVLMVCHVIISLPPACFLAARGEYRFLSFLFSSQQR